MRKFLTLICLIALLVVGVMFWLGTQADSGKPGEGEIRTEIENAF